VPLGFCSVMVSVVVPPAETVDGENRFITPTARTVNRELAAVAFVSPCCVCNALTGILLVYAPCTSDTTFTRMIQLELGAMLPLFKVTEVAPATAVSEAEAPHPVNVGETGLAKETLAGRSSTSEA